MEWSKLNNVVGDMEDLGRLDLPAGTRAEYGPSGESTLLEPDIVSICQETQWNILLRYQLFCTGCFVLLLLILKKHCRKILGNIYRC